MAEDKQQQQQQDDSISDMAATTVRNGGVVGIILPPPEIQNIIDKTAFFVARNGPEFEQRIQREDPTKFAFLRPHDPYHAYYSSIVSDLQQPTTDATPEAAPPSVNTPEEVVITEERGGVVTGTAEINPDKVKKAEREALRAINTVNANTFDGPPNEKPKEFQFVTVAPSLSAVDLDIIKLTAQFVARHGRTFLSEIIEREMRNPQFDFLRPQHSMFRYFTKLTEEYQQILLPSPELLESLTIDSSDRDAILDRVRVRTSHDRYQRKIAEGEKEQREADRVFYAAIDWHDFSVVGTIEFQEDESGDLPPPLRIEELGTRLIAQKRYEIAQQEKISMVQDVAMDVSDDEEEMMVQEAPVTIEEQQPAVPLPAVPESVVIRQGYDPKEAAKQRRSAQSVEMTTCPITGQLVPASGMDEHLRILLLDPRWKEQRDRIEAEKKKRDDVYAKNTRIDHHLKSLAERRTDIFGAEGEKAIGEKAQQHITRVSSSNDDIGGVAEIIGPQALRGPTTVEQQLAEIRQAERVLTGEQAPRPVLGTPLMSQQQQMQQLQQFHAQQAQIQMQQRGGILGHNPFSSSSGGNPGNSNSVSSSATAAGGSGGPLLSVNTAPQIHPSRMGMPQQQQPQQQTQQPPLPPPQQQQHRAPTIHPSRLGGGPISNGMTDSVPGSTSVGGTSAAPAGMPSIHPSRLNPVSGTQGHAGGMVPHQPPDIPRKRPTEPMPSSAAAAARFAAAQEPVKRQKISSALDSLEDEAEWLRQHQNDVNVLVICPTSGKVEWGCDGRTVTFDNIPPNETIEQLKCRIEAKTGMPVKKQKLKEENLSFLKDNCSLAFYNATSPFKLLLMEKTRGR